MSRAARIFDCVARIVTRWADAFLIAYSLLFILAMAVVVGIFGGPDARRPCSAADAARCGGRGAQPNETGAAAAAAAAAGASAEALRRRCESVAMSVGFGEDVVTVRRCRGRPVTAPPSAAPAASPAPAAPPLPTSASATAPLSAS
eukprot:tig00001304_g8111.t1